ncbi:hypothetical protein KC316_g6502 [Hortaea werneckii]|nr:hypothetical protein KC324_g9926 [Hortaea werneckii]KAI7584776.1 hypothetical protein KC316_g6502 [Hortaea werneckii]
MPSSTPQLVTKADMTETFRLLDLPAELRTCIYEYAFTPESPSTFNTILERFESTAPSTALLLTNQLIHQEAHSIYQEAYRRFWTYSVSAVRTEIELQPNLRPRDREETLRRFNGRRRCKPELKFTLFEDHLHMEIGHKFTVKSFWGYMPMYLAPPDPLPYFWHSSQR